MRLLQSLKQNAKQPRRGPVKVRLVGKPLSPPFMDSGKNLARDLVMASDPRQVVFVLWGDPTVFQDCPAAVVEPSKGDVGYVSSLLQKAVLFKHLVVGGRHADLLHAVFAPTLSTSSAARVIRLLARRPVVQTVLSKPKQKSKSLFFGDVVVVLSRTRLEEIKRLGIENVVLIRPGIADPARPSDKDILKARLAIGVGDRPMVLFPGDLEPWGGWRLLVDAVGKVVKEMPDAVLVIAARRKRRDHEQALAGVQETAARSGLGRNVVVLEREVEDMASLLCAAQLVALTPRSLYAKSDVPLVLLEAMALGRPVMTSNIAELKEVVQAGAGIRVAPGDRDRAAGQILSVLRSTEYGRKLGKEARSRFEKEFTSAKSAAEYASLYRRMVVPATRRA